MALRIVGVTIPQEKRIEIALTYIYGIGRANAIKILEATGVSPDKRAKDINEAEENKIREYIKKTFKVEGDLKREVLGNIKRLKEIRSYRGIRHEKNLPVNGQRTKTNSRTVRGNARKTLMSGRKNAPTAK